jgi:hypothetical protein
MSDQYDSPAVTRIDAFIPLALLSIAFIILLGWQVSNASTQRVQFQNAITNQQKAVDQSEQAQKSLAKLATDLLETAKSDDTAKAIAAKYGISQNANAAAAAVPTP